MKTFHLFDQFGFPANPGVANFVFFGSRTGVPGVPPSLDYIGSAGGWQFDESAFIAGGAGQTVYLIETDSNPRWLFGALYEPTLPFAAVFLQKPNGDPYDGGTFPFFTNWWDFAFGTHPPPLITRVGLSAPEVGLFTFAPPPAEFIAGRRWLVDTDAQVTGAIPAYFDGNFEPEPGSGGAGLPIVGNFDPVLAAAVGKTTAISFDVTDSLAALQRVVIAVSFPNLNVYEIAHDGDAQGPRYANQFCSRVAIPNGWRYTLLRDAGWPGSVRIIPMAFDVGGGVNPITSVIYAWTLVEVA